MANGKFEFVQHGIECDKVVQTNCIFASYCRWTCAPQNENTLFMPDLSCPTVPKLTWGSYHLTENFGNSGWKVNGKVTFRKFQPKIEEYVLR